MKKLGYRVCLWSSIAVNIFFLINVYVGGGVGGLRWRQQQQINPALTWTEKAAAEAEEVAAVSCSGHGRAYLDGLTFEGQHVCECYDCYQGLDCSQFSSDCAADADSGDPIFLEPFWMQHAAESAVLVSGWHRMSYTFGDKMMISAELDKYIRKVHAVAGNAVTDGRYLVFGAGSSQLLSAAVYALSSDNSSARSKILASVPFYPIYEAQTEYFNSKNFEFEGDTNEWKSNNSANNTMDLIEFVTSPNNPDGQLKSAVVGGKVIYDHAYYWPHFTPIPAPSDQDLMIFTLSKLTGHAGSRFGWAVIKEKAVYERMTDYIQMAELTFSKDTQLRALKLLKVAAADKHLFNFAYDKMKDRWDRLTFAFSKSTRFSIQHTYPSYCTFFHTLREPSPAYAWVKCEREEDIDCAAVLQTGNIIGRTGSKFSDDTRYVRLSLIKSQDDFELLLQRVIKLVALEGGRVETM